MKENRVAERKLGDLNLRKTKLKRIKEELFRRYFICNDCCEKGNYTKKRSSNTNKKDPKKSMKLKIKISLE